MWVWVVSGGRLGAATGGAHLCGHPPQRPRHSVQSAHPQGGRPPLARWVRNFLLHPRPYPYGWLLSSLNTPTTSSSDRLPGPSIKFSMTPAMAGSPYMHFFSAAERTGGRLRHVRPLLRQPRHVRHRHGVRRRRAPAQLPQAERLHLPVHGRLVRGVELQEDRLLPWVWSISCWAPVVELEASALPAALRTGGVPAGHRQESVLPLRCKNN